MSINQMDKTVQEYKAATNISIQVRAELALFLNDIQWLKKQTGQGVIYVVNGLS